jgi:hypothetical protein
MNTGTATEDDTKANEQRWKNERLEDMMLNNDEPITTIQDDLDLKEKVKEYKEKAVNITKKFRGGIDKVKASSFRLSQD